MSNIFEEDIPEVVAEETTSTTTKDELAQPVAKRFAFIGIGAAGGRIADEFYRKGYRRCMAVNTCESDRMGLSDDLEFINLNVGGSGKNPAVSKDLIAQPQNRVQFMSFFADILGQDFDYAFITCGLGGGTGSGGGPELYKILKEYIESNGIKAKIGVILSFPQASEGSRVAANALAAYEEFIKLGPTPLLLIDNSRVAKIRKSTIASLHKDANKDTATLLHTLNVLAATPAIQTLDSADFSQILDSGMITLGMSGISNWKEGSDVLAKAIMSTFQSATLADVDVSNATQGACVVVAGANVLNTFSNDELMRGLDLLRNSSTCPNMLLHPAIYENSSKGAEDSLRVYVALGGLKPNEAVLRQLAKVGNVKDFESRLANFFGVK
jgi:cell division GTPase FtsZ